MKFIRYIFLLVCLILNFSLLGQENRRPQQRNAEDRPNGIISGKVKDSSNDELLEYTTLSLFSARDSSLVTGGITDTKGNFSLTAPFGRYFLKVEYISYESKTMQGLRLNRKTPTIDIGQIAIKQDESLLNEVEITAEKSQVQIGLEKKVFNVDKDLSSIGGTAAEVLENVPSVIVDMEGNVSLRGSENVRILIDGRPSGLMGISTSKALEQIPANSIETIEIITNPSVRYDAEGIAGIINIVLKKEKKKGFNGMLNMSTGYPDRHNINFNFNYGINKFNVFGALGGRFSENPGLVEYRRTTTANDTTTYLDQDGNFIRGRKSINTRLGIDYYIDKKTTITISSSFSPSLSENSRETDYKDHNTNRLLSDYYIRTTDEKGSSINSDYVFNLTKRFKKKKQKLTADFSYSLGNSDDQTDIIESYELLNYLADNNSDLNQQTIEATQQNNLVAQLDYLHPITKKANFEFGYKTTSRIIDLDYDTEELDISTDDWIGLPNISNHFVYNELIHASYGLFKNTSGKLTYQVGVRAEQTHTISKLLDTEEKYERNYLNFFPSLHISRELSMGNEVQLSYSRRIRRPRHRNLNPFTSYADPLNLWIGNPQLNPELTNSFELGHIKYWENSFLSSSIYYRHTDSVIQRIRLLDTNGVTTTQPENLSYSDAFGLELSFSKSLFKWWKLNGSFNYFRNIIDGGNLGSEYTADAFSWTARVNSQMTLWKKWNLQCMFNYRGPRETTQGIRQEMLFLDIGLRKDILDEKGTLSIKISDVFNSKKFISDTYGRNFHVTSTYQRMTRRYILGFSYKINQYRNKQRKKREGYENSDDMGM